MNGDLQVGAWLVRPSLNTISQNGTRRQLEPKAMDVLLCLARHAPDLVSKEDLLQEVWPNTFVTEDVLVHSIGQLRRVFGDDAKDPRVIQTIAKRGYRLISPVTVALSNASRKPTPPSIAVLPFLNLSGDSQNDFFCDGISEEVINALARIRKLHVVARTSSFAFKGQSVDLRTVGQRLNVDTVLEGSVRRSGERLRITAQLVNAADGYHRWSEKYDREMTDVFAIQEEIANSIAQCLEVGLDDQQPFFKAGTRSLDAFKFYTQGRSLFFQRGARLFPAVECFNKAVELDPNYALAWSGLADSLNTIAFYGFAKPDKSLPRAKEAAQRALQIDPALAEAHTSMALTHLYLDWDWPRAEREFLRSLELKPQNSLARGWYGMLLLQWATGRFEEALAQAQQAVQIDPLSAWSRGVLATIYLPIDAEKSLETALETLRIEPDSYLGRWIQMTALNALSRYSEAAEIGELAIRIFGRPLWFMASLARSYAELGRLADAKALYLELFWRARREYVPPLFLGLAAFAAGNQREGRRCVQEAHEIGDPALLGGRYWPDLVEMRKDPRFQEILRSRGWL